MASTKKNAKGNKTAHVLNLLAPSPADGEEAALEGSGVEPARNPLVSPSLEMTQPDDALLSQQIQQALEEELTQSEEEQWAEEPLPEGMLGWDEHGQPIWDPSVLPEGVLGWDENGQPIWDPNRLPEGELRGGENGRPV